MPHKINHLAIVVPRLDDALRFWRDALGLELRATEENPGENVNIGFLAIGDSQIELLEPTVPESGIGKYLEKRGPGMHHICLEVADLEAAMQRLREHGIELINDTPKTRREDGIRYCFVHPKSAFGVMVELYELPPGRQPA
jgi:methylmalonyl-CoA/ethylmalonyl-CoA epimerase